MQITCGKALTLLLTDPPSSLSATIPQVQKWYNCSLAYLVSHNSKRLWQTVIKLLPLKSSSPLPLLVALHLQTPLLLFFTGEMSKLRLSLTSNPATSSPHSPSPPATPPDFSLFTTTSESEIHKFLSNCPNKQFD